MADLADDFAYRRDLSRRAGKKNLICLRKLFRHDRSLDHFDAAPARETDYRLARNPVQKTIRSRGMQLAVDHQEDISPCALGELAAPIEHQRVVASFGLGHVL